MWKVCENKIPHHKIGSSKHLNVRWQFGPHPQTVWAPNGGGGLYTGYCIMPISKYHLHGNHISPILVNITVLTTYTYTPSLSLINIGMGGVHNDGKCLVILGLLLLMFTLCIWVRVRFHCALILKVCKITLAIPWNAAKYTVKNNT